MSSASLASATGTRVDSASKHIIPCKVHTDYMASLVGDRSGGDAMRELQINKHRYNMAKDDVVIGLGRALYATNINSTKRKAYPAVITTLGGMDKIARRWHAVHNFGCTGYMGMDWEKTFLIRAVEGGYDDPAAARLTLSTDKQACLDKLKQSEQRAAIVQNQIKDMMDMHFMGIALGNAWASPQTGDTVGSVMIGGLRTILNGDFQISTGDLLMFYWPDERFLFEDNGGRVARKTLCMDDANNVLDWRKVTAFIMDDKLNNKDMALEPQGTEMMRKTYYGMGNGNYNGKNQGKIHVAMIKPYITSRHLDENGVPEHFPCDKSRIFGKAISNARPFEMVDIMIATQSL